MPILLKITACRFKPATSLAALVKCPKFAR